MAIKVFEVGGHVRDHLLGIKSKDIDCSVEANSFQEMLEFVETNTKKIFQIKEEFVTIRAMGHDGLPKDFVLCRKDGAYSDGRHPDSVEIGTIFDDLARRDFTVNAIARNVETGEILDPFHGRDDLEAMTLRCVGSAKERFGEDALRVVRAIRFSITKGFEPNQEIWDVLTDPKWAMTLENVSKERIREELLKCFKHDTTKTIMFLFRIHPQFLHEFFENGEMEMWLKPTFEK